MPLARGTTQSSTAQALSQVAAARGRIRPHAELASPRHPHRISTLARSNIASAQATYDRARADLERMRPLAAKAEISQLQFDSYTAAERVAAAQLKAAQDRLAAASQGAADGAAGRRQRQGASGSGARGGGAVPRQRAAGECQRGAGSNRPTRGIQQARANLAAAELQLSYTTIVAPTDGEVTRKTVEVGPDRAAGTGLDDRRAAA